MINNTMGMQPIGQDPNDAKQEAGGPFQGATHQTICIFHCLFKILAFVCYMFGKYLFKGYIDTFIFVTILLALDFWTVKNITGRKLAGLRWSSQTNEDGSDGWLFQSVADETVLNPVDRNVFWMVLYIWPAIWLIIAIANFISFNFSWLVLVCLAIGFATANLVGFWKCSKDAKNTAKGWATQGALSAMTSGIGSGIGGLAGFASSV